MTKKKKDPWTDPDPQPGDFDEWLANAKPGDVEVQVMPPGSIKFVYIGNEDPNDYVRRKRAEKAGSGTDQVERLVRKRQRS